jgi:hypothetical protein
VPKPWDTRPAAKTGEKKDSAIYEAVGRALSQWEHLESKLADLFAFMVGTYREPGLAPSQPALRAYGAVVGSAARIGMLEEAAKAHFRLHENEILQRRLEKLCHECRQFAGQRNNIAHGVAVQFFNSRPARGLAWYLQPSPYGAKKNPMDAPPGYSYTSVEIGYFTDQFGKLYVRVEELIRDMTLAQL